MPESDTRQITMLLNDVDAGRTGAMDDLMSTVYDDLERMAAAHLRKQFGRRAEQITLEPAALVNESFMRLIRQRNRYDNRGHFFAIATKMMFRVLIDYRRAHLAKKRGGDETAITLLYDEQAVDQSSPSPTAHIDLEALQEALSRLEKSDGRLADIVRMKIVWGLSTKEIADSLEVSEPTVKRQWRFARAWLAQEMEGRSAADQEIV